MLVEQVSMIHSPVETFSNVFLCLNNVIQILLTRKKPRPVSLKEIHEIHFFLYFPSVFSPLMSYLLENEHVYAVRR